MADIDTVVRISVGVVLILHGTYSIIRGCRRKSGKSVTLTIILGGIVEAGIGLFIIVM